MEWNEKRIQYIGTVCISGCGVCPKKSTAPRMNVCLEEMYVLLI